MPKLYFSPFFALLLSACNGSSGTDTGPCSDCDTASNSNDSGDVYWDGPTVIINEFMADNATTIQSPNGEYSDWIELHNLSSERISLAGWSITDDLEEPEMYVLGDTFIDPNGYELLWADDIAAPGHVPFRLGKDGEEIGLYDSDGNAHTRLIYEAQATDWSAARIPDGSTIWEIVDNATPGASNGGP